MAPFWELVGTRRTWRVGRPSGRSAPQWHRLRRGTRPTYVGRVPRGHRSHRGTRTRRPTDL